MDPIIREEIAKIKGNLVIIWQNLPGFLAFVGLLALLVWACLLPGKGVGFMMVP
jgi:hypothetical protein